MGKKARIVRLVALYMAQKSTAQYVEYSIESVKCLLNSRGVFRSVSAVLMLIKVTTGALEGQE